MLTAQQFWDRDFFLSIQQDYEKARRYLKTCGKPKDQYEEALIAANKELEAIGKMILSVGRSST